MVFIGYSILHEKLHTVCSLSHYTACSMQYTASKTARRSTKNTMFYIPHHPCKIGAEKTKLYRFRAKNRQTTRPSIRNYSRKSESYKFFTKKFSKSQFLTKKLIKLRVFGKQLQNFSIPITMIFCSVMELSINASVSYFSSSEVEIRELVT